MKELFRSNNAVELSFAEAVLKARGLTPILLDLNMSILDGSIGALPRRLAIADEDYELAHKSLLEAGLIGRGPVESMELSAQAREELGALSDDRFLGGRLSILQPKSGFRAAVDSVLLPACVAPENGFAVLDAGAGAGVASLCLLAREPSYQVTGFETQSALAELARLNALRNGFEIEVECRDLFESARDARRPLFDQVMSNPPYFEEYAGTPPPLRAKARAHVIEGETGPAAWIAACLAHLRPGGTLTLIHRADRQDEILEVLLDIECAVNVLPFLPKPSTPAKRIIVQARLGASAPVRILPGFVLHGETEKYTSEAEAVLRHAQPIAMN